MPKTTTPDDTRATLQVGDSAPIEVTDGGLRRAAALLTREYRRILYDGKKVDEGEQIPVPGKGTSEYNCGEDAVFGFTCPADSLADATFRLANSVLETRKRYGGEGWLPERVRGGGR